MYKSNKRQAIRPKRSYEKKAKYEPVPRRAVRTQTTFIKRSFPLQSIAVAEGTYTAHPYQFRLDTLPNYSEITNLFNQYRINAVKLSFTPYYVDNNLANTVNTYYAMPRVYTLIDRNGIPPGQLATEAQFLEYGTAKQIVEPNKPFSIYIKKPCVELASAGDVATNPSVMKWNPWVDVNNPTIPHHGCAVGMTMPAGLSGTFFTYHVVATYFMEFKNTN